MWTFAHCLWELITIYSECTCWTIKECTVQGIKHSIVHLLDLRYSNTVSALDCWGYWFFFFGKGDRIMSCALFEIWRKESAAWVVCRDKLVLVHLLLLFFSFSMLIGICFIPVSFLSVALWCDWMIPLGWALLSVDWETTWYKYTNIQWGEVKTN